MKKYKITVNGIPYDVTVEEGEGSVQSAPAPVKTETAPPAASAPASGGISVEAPMPGNILDIKVSQGSAVKNGDVLVILEAMKMENEIVAPSDGNVASINVRKGDAVETGQVIITLS